MSFVNFSTKEITSKIVYYGAGLCGKTTTLQYVYDSIVPENKGQMVSLATDIDRTIYFDFLPLKLGKIQDFSVRIQLYTVPGQVRYNSTRKLVLSGTDGVVFVADSQRDLLEENVQSFRNLIENLEEHGLALETLPHIYQFNKRDLPNLASLSELNHALNPHQSPHFETCATTGEGVLEGLKTISKLVMQDLSRKGVVKRRKYGPGVSDVANRTDTVLRPVVGPASRLDPLDITASVEEYEGPLRVGDIAEGDSEPSGSLDFTAMDLDHEPTKRVARRPLGLTFATIFIDPDLADRMLALETALSSENQPAVVQKLSRELFSRLIEDSRFFPPDMTESSRISMLGISLRKYAHFYRLLSQSSLDLAEGLFLIHFLIDVHFGKGMP